MSSYSIFGGTAVVDPGMHFDPGIQFYPELERMKRSLDAVSELMKEASVDANTPYFSSSDAIVKKIALKYSVSPEDLAPAVNSAIFSMGSYSSSNRTPTVREGSQNRTPTVREGSQKSSPVPWGLIALAAGTVLILQ